MPRFSYRAANSSGKIITGTIEATDRNAAVNTLTKQSLKPLSLTLAGASGGNSFFSLSLGGSGKKVKSDDLVVFTRQLSTMVGAGVPLLRALTTLQVQSESAGLKKILAVVVKDVEGGLALGDAFDKHPKVFSSVYTNMVRAGEAAGILDEILKRLAFQQEKNASMRKKIKSAMSYPTVLLVITVAAFFGLMIFVIPQIGKIIKNLGGEDAELPAITQAMLAISDFMVARWYIVLGGMVLGGWLLLRWIRTPAGKEKFQTLLIKAPVIGPVVKKIAVARFARTFASLMGAGVNVLESLRVTGRAVGNVVFQKELEAAALEVKSGKQLSQALSDSKLFPAIIPQMLAVGEETGQTDTVLVKVADFYEEEVDATIDSLSSIIEPIMITFMGAMVGLIAYSVMGPISGLANQIQT